MRVIILMARLQAPMMIGNMLPIARARACRSSYTQRQPPAVTLVTVGGGLTMLWAAMALMMTVRMLTLWLRSRSGRWIVTGATR